MKRIRAVIGIIAMAISAMAAPVASEKMVVMVAPPEKPSVVFPGYSVEKINLVTDRGVIIPWRITFPQ
jgi:hypothetical protein